MMNLFEGITMLMEDDEFEVSYEMMSEILGELGYTLEEGVFNLMEQLMEHDPESDEFAQLLQTIGEDLGVPGGMDGYIALFMDIQDIIYELYYDDDFSIPPFDVLQDVFNEFGYNLSEDAYNLILELDLDPESEYFQQNLEQLGGALGITDYDEMMTLYENINMMMGEPEFPPYDVLMNIFGEMGYNLDE